MARNNNIEKIFSDKKNEYTKKLMKINKASKRENEKLVILNIRKEQLEKGKELLDILSGLLTQRSEKANRISSLINSGKDLSETKSELEDVNRINNEINDTKEELKKIRESSSDSIFDMLKGNLSNEEIKKALKQIEKELSSTKKEIIKNEEKNKANNEIKEKYEKYISYIERYLNGTYTKDSKENEELLETDLVYQYAKKEGIESIIKKMKERSLTAEEYEDILIKTAPIHAYIIHGIEISQSEYEKQEYYIILDKIENGSIGKEELKELENKCHERISYKSSFDDNITSEDNQNKKDESTDEEGIDVRELINQVKRIDDRGDREIKIKTIRENFKKIKKHEDKITFIKEIKKKGRKRFIENDECFKDIIKELKTSAEEQNNLNVEKETDGVFSTLKEYEEFKSRKNGSEFALQLLNNGKIDFFFKHIKYFKGLDEEVLKKIIENGKYNNEILFHNKIFGIEINKFLIILIENNIHLEQIRTKINKEKKLTSELACKLIEGGYMDEFEKLLTNGYFEKLSKDVIKLLINQGTERKQFILKHKKYFVEFNLKEIIPGYGEVPKSKTITYNDIIEELKNRNRITDLKKANLTQEELLKILGILIEQEKWDDLAKNLDAYPSESLNISIATELIKKGKGKDVAKYSYVFKGKFDKQTTKLLIEQGCSKEIAKFCYKFKGLTYDIAKIVINNKHLYFRREIKDFDEEYHELIAEELIKKGDSRYFTKYFDEFKIKDYSKIAKTLIETHQGIKLIENIEKFEGISIEEIIKLLIETQQGIEVAENIKKFKGINHSETANQLIEYGFYESLAQNLNRFPGVDKYEIAKKIIEKGGYEYVLVYLQNFRPKLGEKFESPTALITEDQWKEFGHRIRLYERLDPIIAFHLIINGKSYYVAKNPQSFEGRLNEKITNALVDNGFESDIIRQLEYYEGLDFEIAKKIIEPRKIAKNIRSFKLSSHNKIAEYLIKNGCGPEVAANFYDFKGADKERLAKILINLGYSDFLLRRNQGDLERGKSYLAEKLREFFRSYEKIDRKIFHDKHFEFYKEFANRYGINIFPRSWDSLFEILGGKPGLQNRKYLEALLKSKEDGDEYYREYILGKNKRVGKIKEKTAKDIFDLFGTKDDEGKKISNAKKLKKDLTNKWGLDKIFIELINEDNNGALNINEIKTAFDEYKKSNPNSEITLNDICEIMELEGVEIIGKIYKHEEDDGEDRDTKEQYTKGNLGRIQKFLDVNNGVRNLFKELINDKGEIKKESLDVRIKNTGFKIPEEFEKKLRHFGIHIVENNEEFEEIINTPKEFIEKFEALGFVFKNKDKFLENLELAFKSDPDMGKKLSEVIKRINSYSKNSKEIKNPIQYVESHNRKNDNFSVIKFHTTINAPRIILEANSYVVLAIVRHEDYDKIRGKQKGQRIIKLEGIENRKHWY